MINIPCHCGNNIESGLNPEIDLSDKPEIYAEIIQGDFMTFHCSKCDNDIKTETALHLFDKDNKLDIDFLPELDRIHYLNGQIKVKAERLVIGYKELVEKIVIAGEKFDDRIIEIIKFRMLEKASSDDINIYLNSIGDDELMFYVYGLKLDQVGISRIPFSVYEKINSELSELLKDDDIKLFTDGPYVSVNRIYLED